MNYKSPRRVTADLIKDSTAQLGLQHDSASVIESDCKGVFTPGKSAGSLALVRTKYSVDFYCLFGAVRFHTALFESEPEIVNTTTRVLRSSFHWTEILKQGKQQVQNRLIFHSAIFILLLIWCNKKMQYE